MEKKPFKSIDEQLEILKSRGLIIDNEDIAKEFLLHNNYYRISGYSLTLRKNDRFYKKVTLQNIIDIYSFDHDLRHILLKYIELIEVKIKSVFVYKLTEKHGAFGYLNPVLFTDEETYTKIIKKAENQKQIRLSNEAYLKHFINDLNQDVPFWAYVDLLTISDISFLYSISEEDIQKSVALEFGLNMKNRNDLLGHFMHRLTIIRNLCAHGSRLFNRLFEQKPKLSKKELSLLIKNKDEIVDNAHLYGFIFILRKLLSESQFQDLKNEIIGLTQKYPFVSMRYYGFRDDWKNVL